MTIDFNTIPSGWRFYSSDFSRGNTGSVTLKRDSNGTMAWLEIAENEPDENKWPALYASGRGSNFESALADACKIASGETVL